MQRRRVCAIVAAVLVAIALLVTRPPGEPGVTLRDFEAYYTAGATWAAHGDPYSLAIWSAQSHIPGVIAARYEVLPFVGVPATLPLWSLFARLPYQSATVVWSVVLGCALATFVIGTARLVRLSPMQTTLAAIAALAFVPITSNFGLGQAALPAYACAVIALVTRPVVASLAVALSAIQPNVALGLAAMARSKRAARALAAGLIIAYGAGAFADGAAWPARYLATLAAHGAAERFASIQYTPAAVLYGFGVPHAAAQALAILVGVAAFIFAIRGALTARNVAHRFAILCCAIPFVAGFFHEHDFVALFVPAIVALTYARNSILAVVATVCVGVNWLDFAQQPQALPQDIVLAAGLFVAAIGFGRSRVSLLVAIPVTGAIVLGAWIGHAHPLAIWPNDMQGAAHGATVADVWKNEQLKTGLLRPDAAAAALRSFALLGSALLFYLVLNVDVHHIVERRDTVGTEVP